MGGQLAAFETVERTVRTAGTTLLLPGHGQPTHDAAALITLNRNAVEHACEAVLAACDGVGTEGVLANVAERLELSMTDLPRYHLNFTTVTAYLGYLRAEGRVSADLSAGRLTWSRT